MNIYAYVHNDPVNLIDPMGLRVFLAARSVEGVGVHYFVVVDRGGGDVTIFSYGPSTEDFWNPGALVPSAISPDRTNEDDFDAYNLGDDLIGMRELYVSDDAAAVAGEAVDDMVLNSECHYNFTGLFGGCNSNSGANLLLHLLGYEFIFGPLGGGIAPGWDQWDRLLIDSSGCPQGVPGGDIIVCAERTGGVGGGYGGIGMGGTLGMGSRPMLGVQGGLCGRVPCPSPRKRS